LRHATKWVAVFLVSLHVCRQDEVSTHKHSKHTMTECQTTTQDDAESEFLTLLCMAMYGQTPEQLGEMLRDMMDIVAGHARPAN